jgi:hypothetical protein
MAAHPFLSARTRAICSPFATSPFGHQLSPQYIASLTVSIEQDTLMPNQPKLAD